MFSLILLRHAHAEPASDNQHDLDRPLSARGEHEAHAAGAWLAARKVLPQRVLCSPSRRTRDTAERVLSALSEPPACQVERSLYEATPGMLLALVKAHAEVDTLLLLGHNPGLQALLAGLLKAPREPLTMLPASLAFLCFPGWPNLGEAELTTFWSSA